jgi:hypothetical protein
MNRKQGVVIAGAGLACLASVGMAVAGTDGHKPPATGLVQVVRLATADFRDVANAVAAGYASTASCVSGPEEGAMGVHFANGALFADGALEARRPEVLVYEQKNGRLRLVAVEYVVIAEQWHANNPDPPVLMGQHFHYVGSPNRYGGPPFYELHVWAWKDNPHGMYVDWNPAVSCEEYEGTDGHH